MAKPYKKQPDDRVVDDLTKPGMGAQVRASLMEKNRALLALSGDSDALVPVVGAAPVDEAYVTIGNTSGLTAERALTGTANQITVTDNGANSTVVLSSPLAANAYVTIGNTANLSAERALTGTANQITVTDNGANSTVVLSIPPQPLLSAFHSDTLAGTVARGDIIIGNTTPKWAKLTIGGSNNVLFSDGTDVSWASGALFSSSTPSITTKWQWATDVGGHLEFLGDYSLDPLLIDLSDNNSGNIINLYGPGFGLGSGFDKRIRWPDASGTYVLVGDDSDPPAACFIGKVNRTAQVATIAATVLADSAIGATYLVVHYTLEVTTSAVGAGTIQFQVNYTDDVGATTQVSAALILTATGRTRGTLEVYATGGITYQTNLTGIFSTSDYALRVRCENLG